MTSSGPCIFGEVLLDCFPDGTRVLGGAPVNVAWHLHAFGAAPRLLSRVGDDANGALVRDAMRGWGMETAGLQTDPSLPTGQVNVTFAAGEPAYDILHPCAWDAIEAAPTPATELLYHGTLAARAATSRATLDALVKAHAGTVFVDVNLRPPWWRAEVLERMLAAADWVKINADELAEVAGADATAASLQEDRGLSGVILTRGAAGAELVTASGTHIEVAPERSDGVVDTVGAGDAFTAVILLGLLRAWPEDLALRRAQSFASHIVRQRGATVRERDFYRPFVADWHLDT